MNDSASAALFEQLIEPSHVLESLSITLKQMLEGSYISKNTAVRIMREASNQYHRLLKCQKYSFPRHFLIGHLKHYRQSEDVWTFSVTNPVLSLSVSNTVPGGRSSISVIDDRFAAGGSMRIQSNMPLSMSNIAFCHSGCVKIKAVVNGAESD